VARHIAVGNATSGGGPLACATERAVVGVLNVAARFLVALRVSRVPHTMGAGFTRSVGDGHGLVAAGVHAGLVGADNAVPTVGEGAAGIGVGAESGAVLGIAHFGDIIPAADGISSAVVHSVDTTARQAACTV